jgi:hypothetical protein
VRRALKAQKRVGHIRYRPLRSPVRSIRTARSAAHLEEVAERVVGVPDRVGSDALLVGSPCGEAGGRARIEPDIGTGIARIVDRGGPRDRPHIAGAPAARPRGLRGERHVGGVGEARGELQRDVTDAGAGAVHRYRPRRRIPVHACVRRGARSGSRDTGEIRRAAREMERRRYRLRAEVARVRFAAPGQWRAQSESRERHAQSEAERQHPQSRRPARP